MDHHVGQLLRRAIQFVRGLRQAIKANTTLVSDLAIEVAFLLGRIATFLYIAYFIALGLNAQCKSIARVCRDIWDLFQ